MNGAFQGELQSSVTLAACGMATECHGVVRNWAWGYAWVNFLSTQSLCSPEDTLNHLHNKVCNLYFF